MIATAGTGGRGANSSVQREPIPRIRGLCEAVIRAFELVFRAAFAPFEDRL
jgi:hypothetical protein